MRVVSSPLIRDALIDADRARPSHAKSALREVLDHQKQLRNMTTNHCPVQLHMGEQQLGWMVSGAYTSPPCTDTPMLTSCAGSGCITLLEMTPCGAIQSEMVITESPNGVQDLRHRAQIRDDQ